ncbi:MAG: DnaD domain protein [Ruminococcus sp.]|nr:DnaD domain protein [Ruminococcus sp.]
MSVRINLGSWGSVFAVPSSIVDEHLKLASPQQLKVILFLLRNSEKSYTYKEIGDTLLIHEEDVKDSVTFWKERGVLAESGDELVPDDSSATESAPVSAESDKPAPSAKPATVVSRPQKPDIITAAQRVSSDENLRNMLAMVESILSKPLSSGDTSTLVMLYDTCGLPAEVIVTLVGYCRSISKGNMRTIERLGVKWADEGIDTLEAADNKIAQTKRSNANWSRISSVFGLKNIGSPTVKQLEFADVWIEKWHFSDEMLRRAYEINVDTTGKMSAAYINKILNRWYNAGVFKPEDIEKLDAKKSSKKSEGSKSESSYNIDELDKIQ